MTNKRFRIVLQLWNEKWTCRWDDFRPMTEFWRWWLLHLLFAHCWC